MAASTSCCASCCLVVALEGAQAGFQAQGAGVAQVGGAEQVQARHDLHVSHPGRVALQQLLHPLGLVLGALRGGQRREPGGAGGARRPLLDGLTLQASLLSALCGTRKEKTRRAPPHSSRLRLPSWQLLTTVKKWLGTSGDRPAHLHADADTCLAGRGRGRAPLARVTLTLSSCPPSPGGRRSRGQTRVRPGR